MAGLRYNPFKPGKIVHPAMFAGRTQELLALEKLLFAAKHGNPSHFLIHGERGIGKSSLDLYVNSIAQGKEQSLSKQQFKFITLNVDLDIHTGFVPLLRKIGNELQNQLKLVDVYKSLLTDIWGLINRWEVAGVKYDRSKDNVETDEMLNNLVSTLAESRKRLGNAIDGFFILIDEADKPPADAHLGEFVKMFTERLDKQQCNNVLLGLSGISNVIDKLRDSHESSVRVLTQFPLKPLGAAEAKDVVIRGLQEAKAKNGVETKITDNALEWLAIRGSEGYPHFIQEYAYHAFESDSNDVIDSADLNDAVYRKNGALDQLGAKYFAKMYLEDIRSDDYRTVLQVMADEGEDIGTYVSKATIREKSGLSDHTLANALNALKKRQIVVPKPGVNGEYRLVSRSFAVWVKVYGDKQT